MRKLCFVTGTRAEYGLLSRLMKLVKEDSNTHLQIIATNMHLQEEFGNTYMEIENDGFLIDRKVYMNASSDTPFSIVSSMCNEMCGINSAFNELRPDLIVVLGDRYEILVVVTVALMHKIPVAHIHGGEITEGAIDDSIRHAVTKMSHLHFTSTEVYRRRVIQMGENPNMVWNVGALGVENVRKIELLDKATLEKTINFSINSETVLVTYHPVTKKLNDINDNFMNLIYILDRIKKLRIIFTLPNSDEGNKLIATQIENFVNANKDRSIFFRSLGMVNYFSTIKYVGFVIGNSSSGIIEVPTFGKPSINIGDRQRGRISSASVIHCDSDKDSIYNTIVDVMNNIKNYKENDFKNPYDTPNTAQNIFNVLRDINLDKLLHKSFNNLHI